MVNDIGPVSRAFGALQLRHRLAIAIRLVQPRGVSSASLSAASGPLVYITHQEVVLYGGYRNLTTWQRGVKLAVEECAHTPPPGRNALSKRVKSAQAYFRSRAMRPGSLGLL